MVVCVLWQRFVVGINKAAHTTMGIWVAGGARIFINLWVGSYPPLSGEGCPKGSPKSLGKAAVSYQNCNRKFMSLVIGDSCSFGVCLWLFASCGRGLLLAFTRQHTQP